MSKPHEMHSAKNAWCGLSALQASTYSRTSIFTYILFTVIHTQLNKAEKKSSLVSFIDFNQRFQV